MNRLCLFFLVLLLFIQNEAISQDALRFDCSLDYYYVNHAPITLITVDVHNESDSDFVLWISNDTSDADIEEKLYNYFWTRQNSYSLAEIFYELRDFHDFEVDVGYTFLKKIKPSETFSLICYYNFKAHDSIEMLFNTIKKHLVYIPKRIIDERFHFQRYAENGIFYPEDRLVLFFDKTEIFFNANKNPVGEGKNIREIENYIKE